MLDLLVTDEEKKRPLEVKNVVEPSVLEERRLTGKLVTMDDILLDKPEFDTPYNWLSLNDIPIANDVYEHYQEYINLDNLRFDYNTDPELIRKHYRETTARARIFGTDSMIPILAEAGVTKDVLECQLVWASKQFRDFFDVKSRYESCTLSEEYYHPKDSIFHNSLVQNFDRPWEWEKEKQPSNFMAVAAKQTWSRINKALTNWVTGAPYLVNMVTGKIISSIMFPLPVPENYETIQDKTRYALYHEGDTISVYDDYLIISGLPYVRRYA